MPQHSEIVAAIETAYPLSLQENWDNSGWQLGNPNDECLGVVVAVEATEATVQETIDKGANLLITHHPLLFKPMKRIGVQTYQERVVALALRNNVAIYAAHTNADNATLGINHHLAQRLGLRDTQALAPLSKQLYKLNVMVPVEALECVEQAITEMGAGQLGNYDHCSFKVQGTGSFRPLEGASPYSGHVGAIHNTPEISLQVLVAQEFLSGVLKALRKTHPYEEPAFDIIPLANATPKVGSGIIGILPAEITEQELLNSITQWQHVNSMRHSHLLEKKVRKIAICGGSGGSFLSDAIRAKADVYITGEAKYNDFIDAQGNLLLVTIGHFESESIARTLFKDIISAKFATFATQEAENDINPVNYQ